MPTSTNADASDYGLPLAKVYIPQSASEDLRCRATPKMDQSSFIFQPSPDYASLENAMHALPSDSVGLLYEGVSEVAYTPEYTAIAFLVAVSLCSLSSGPDKTHAPGPLWSLPPESL